MMSKEYDIPFELEIEIMKRLPIKSLLIFRSVSKPWKSIINGSEFIADYSKNHAHHYNPQQLLLLGFSEHNNNVYILNDDINHLPLLKCSVPIPSSLKPSSYNLIGYSQGLFAFFNYHKLLTADEHVVVIWNPSIRKSVVIPVPNVVSNWPSGTVVGFGVCNATDPMIVKINFIPSQVEVFKLSTGVWTTLSKFKSPPPCLPLQLTRKVVTIDNLIYWVAFYESVYGRNSLILSFDSIKEEFKQITLPSPLAKTLSSNLALSKLRDSLAVVQPIYRVDENKWMYDVWMRDDGVQNNFKKLYTVKQPYRSRQCVSGFRNNGQPIIERYGDNYEARFFVYEPDSKCFKDIEISRIRHSSSSFAGSYTGTLLLLDCQL